MTHRILIVDDHRDVIRLLHSALDSLEHEFEIIETPSGEEAFLEVSRNNIDLAVIDYLLPGMSGLELMAKIKARNPDAQIILISGSKERKIRNELRDAGAFAFFEKPISLTDFLDAVERCLEIERTVLPTEEDNGEVSDAHKNMSGLLAKFRQNMKAQVIFLLSDQGHVLARAGVLEDSSLEASLLSALMGIFRAGQKVSGYIHQETPLSYHIFPGGDQDVLLVPVNHAHALVVAGEKIAERKKVLDLTDALMMLKSEVEHVLDAIGITRPSAEEMDEYLESEDIPEEQVEDEITSNELDALFKQKTKIQTDEITSFWDDAVETQKVQEVDADKLSYEQAQQLGLTPQDDA
ncbi:MAG: response regulator [Anaerolineae bacterium]|jgi:CheY-like chemotaxis protein|nr:response regulator [Anaerolineae bacterium]MBT3711759.1 response regulator [Anaerolineae bacterium]MBT4312532.1 response regulator [Anaerolineae bacterium]MBT4457655.1 response regulator [Anaerolineae bacterium]MBT4841150.1 response regulator [Anaerolineae bacterium]